MVNFLQTFFVVDCFMYSDKEGESGRKLYSAAQLLMSPMQAAKLVSQVLPACAFQGVLENLGLV